MYRIIPRKPREQQNPHEFSEFLLISFKDLKEVEPLAPESVPHSK